MISKEEALRKISISKMNINKSYSNSPLTNSKNPSPFRSGRPLPGRRSEKHTPASKALPGASRLITKRLSQVFNKSKASKVTSFKPAATALQANKEVILSGSGQINTANRWITSAFLFQKWGYELPETKASRRFYFLRFVFGKKRRFRTFEKRRRSYSFLKRSDILYFTGYKGLTPSTVSKTRALARFPRHTLGVGASKEKFNASRAGVRTTAKIYAAERFKPSKARDSFFYSDK